MMVEADLERLSARAGVATEPTLRALVTGASGFVGGFLVEALRAGGRRGACRAADRAKRAASISRSILAIARTLRAALDAARPTVVFHLAAQTFVPDSLRAPLETYEVNAMGTARLAKRGARLACAAPSAAHRLCELGRSVRQRASRTSFRCAKRSICAPPIRTARAKRRPKRSSWLNRAASGSTSSSRAPSITSDRDRSEHFVVASLAAQLARIAARRRRRSCSSGTSRRRATFSTCATSSPHTSRSRATANAVKSTTFAAGRPSLFATSCAS